LLVVFRCLELKRRDHRALRSHEPCGDVRKKYSDLMFHTNHRIFSRRTL
jgi:hypothetical protein